MATAQMTYQIDSFNAITIGDSGGNGPLPQFTGVSVANFVPDGTKVTRDGTSTGLIVSGSGSYDIDFTVRPPASHAQNYSYTVVSALFKLKSGTGSTAGLADEFPKQVLSVDKDGVNWLTITDKNNANSGNSPVFEFYLVVHRSDGLWGLIDPQISNKP